MRTRTLYIAAYTLADAVAIAQAVEAGRVTERDYHRDEDKAEQFATELARTIGRPIPVFPVVLEKRAVDDGVITNAWPVDRVGDAAAAFLLFVAAPALAARFWWVFA